MPLTNRRTSDDVCSDVILLQRIVAKDQTALGELYDQNSRVLFGLLVRILGNRSEAEEVLQDVFLTVWAKAESYKAVLGSPLAWLVGITRNRGIDRLRCNAVRARTLEVARGEDFRTFETPEVSAAHNERKRTIQQALAALPGDQRELIEHAYFLGLTHSELAQRFTLPLGTVKTRVRTAMTTLREQLAGQAR